MMEIHDFDTQLSRAEALLDKSIILGSTVFTPGATGVDLDGIVDINRGRVNVVGGITGTMKISYTALGRTITKETLAVDPLDGDVLYTAYWPIDYKSVHLYNGDTELDALECDIVEGKYYFTKTKPGDTSGDIDFDYYTALEDAKLETRKVDTNFITFRGYTDEDGIILSAQTSEDGNRDFLLQLSGYQSEILANVSAQAACQDQYIKLESA